MTSAATKGTQASDIQVTLAAAAARLSAQNPFNVVFDRGDDISVELYAPVGRDNQTPHERDELYIVTSGHGTFSRGDELVSFGPGDLLYVPAYVPHRFETFSDDFKTWVIFYGPKRTAPRERDAV
ncbi:cupin domain-containing protein [Microvirga sp. GCM10011540]|uniref:cupin domain-containing protein n=1 Tax=Microvirga sp. GCM10011540 TaxID=3317338 RepID=UPI0036075073